MIDQLLSQPTLWRSGLFALTLIIIITAELVQPRRKARFSRRLRWPGNFVIIALGTVAVRLCLPLAPFSVAVIVWQEHGGLYGLFSLSDHLPYPLLIGLSLLLYDGAIYLQHVLFHAVPILWRLHRVHHSDQDYDCTTGFRFHPLEIVISAGVKIGIILVLGAPPEAFLIFEIILSSCALFNHGNIAIPAQTDRWLRWLLVTPDVHRVHHSVLAHEMHRNYGFCVPWWDRLFGTYCPAPQDGHSAMRIGVPGQQGRQAQTAWGMIVQPFSDPSKADLPSS